MNLKEITTQELIAVLSTHIGVAMSRSGMYQPYELIKKYDGSNEHIEARILIINDTED